MNNEEKFQLINKNLQRLGSFTINDSRIYTTLLMIGLSSPAKISEKSQVDRARVYDSLKRLVKRGIVEEEPVPRAPRYRAIPPEKVFGEIRKKLGRKIDLADDLEKQLANIKMVQPTESNSVWSIQGESKIRKQFEQFLSESKKFAIIILTLDNSSSSIRELEHLTELLLDKQRDMQAYSIKLALKIFPDSREQRNLINQLFHANVEIYRWNAGAILPFGIYLTEHSFIQTYLSSLNPRPAYAYGIFMENATEEQLIGFQHLCIWVNTHLCQKVVFKKKSKENSSDFDDDQE